MKTPSEDLSQLIKTMSRDEKRYFRQLALNQRTGKESLNLLLFNEMEKQEEYDEAALKLHFSDQLNENQFAVAKNHLYQFLLKALVYFSPGRGFRLKVRELLQEVEILFHRELYDQCRRLLDRATKLAAEADHPFLQLEVAEWRMRLWTSQYFRDVGRSEFTQVNETFINAAHKTLRLAEYKASTNELVYHYRTSSVLQKQAEFRAVHAARMNTPLFADPEMADSIPARIQFHYGQGFYLFNLGKAAESFLHYSEIMRYLEEYPEHVYDYFNFYLPIMYGHAVLALTLGNYDAAGQSIDKIEKLQTEHPSQKSKNYYYTHILRIEYLFATRQTASLLAHLENSEKKAAQVSKYLSPQENLNFLVNTSSGWYVVGQKKKALNLMNTMQKFPNLAAYPDYHFMSMTLRILLNYELQNEDVLPSLIRSFERWVEKKEKPFLMEQAIVASIPALLGSATRKKTISLLLNLRARVLQLAEDPEELRTSRYFDYLAWIDSQIEGLPYGEIIIRKVTEAS